MAITKRPGFQVGDIVTRDGTDLHRVIETNGCDQYPPDSIDVECIKEPLGYLEEDGVTRGEPWTRLGERESNLARRYTYPDETLLEGAAVSVSAAARIDGDPQIQTKGEKEMNTPYISRLAVRIAFSTSEPGAHDRKPDGRVANGQERQRWSEIAVYHDPNPVVPGKPWVAVVRGCSTYPGETMREEKLHAGTMERALKIVDPNTQLGRSVIAQAEEWVASYPEPGTMTFPLLKGRAVPVGDNRFDGETDAEALAWLYGDELANLTPAKLLERDFGVVEGTVRAAQKAGREIKLPLAAVMRFFDREAFHRDRATTRG